MALAAADPAQRRSPDRRGSRPRSAPPAPPAGPVACTLARLRPHQDGEVAARADWTPALQLTIPGRMVLRASPVAVPAARHTAIARASASFAANRRRPRSSRNLTARRYRARMSSTSITSVG